jgi:APA family basic amino acid/polyamine antiporter
VIDAPSHDRRREPPAGAHTLARRLTLFDATMIVMGGIVGAGIFMNPAVVARSLTAPASIMGAWVAGGAIALAGAFIYAELAARRPDVGGQYAYLRDAFHPLVAFLYGWTLLLVSTGGGLAAVAMTFARYLRELSGAGGSDGAVAAAALAALTAVNCLGVKSGSNVQSTLMVMKIGAIVMLVVVGAGSPVPDRLPAESPDTSGGLDALTAFGAALVPVLFAYGGWQTASFMAGELAYPRRDLPRGLLMGVSGVLLLYLAVNAVCLRVLGPSGLAATTAPASELMRAALGETGAVLIAAGIAVSTLGFLSHGLLTAPRVYYAMATDGVFFRGIAQVHARTQVPVRAILLQGGIAIVIALSGRYDQILSYVVSIDWVFFGLTALSLIVFRRRDRAEGRTTSFSTPGHPVTTLVFVVVSWLVVGNTVFRDPEHTAVGMALLLAGVPVYFLWRRARRQS